MDLDGNSRLTLAEARSIDPSFDVYLFTARDKAGKFDGVVTYEEFHKFFYEHGGLMALFVRIDTNHDGYIERAEGERFLVSLEPPPSPPPTPSAANPVPAQNL